MPSPMALSEEQKQTVAAWVAAGDNLSAIQRKLAEQLKISMTYMDVRFLVDDLNLRLKDAPPKVDTTIGKGGAGQPAASEKKGFFDKAKEKLGLAKNEAAGGEDLPEDAEEDLDAGEDLGSAGGGNVSVSVDKATLIPGAIASGTVTFSDGVTGKWIVDNYGRPGFTQLSKPEYRPKPADAEAFVKQLGAALQKRGF